MTHKLGGKVVFDLTNAGRVMYETMHVSKAVSWDELRPETQEQYRQKVITVLRSLGIETEDSLDA